MYGLVPGTHSTPAEVIAIAEAVRDSGHGVFQYVSDDLGTGGDEPWLNTLKQMGCPTTYTLAQTPTQPDAYRGALAEALRATDAGATVTPQIPVRPTGMLYGLQSSFPPFIAHRGRLEPGLTTDLNVIDFAGLHRHGPRMAFDLPAGGRGLLQDVDGYLHTIKSGDVTFTDGQPTGARPGTVLRSGR
jgi:hypothetical protein